MPKTIGPMKIKDLHREARYAALWLADVERDLKDAKHDLLAREALDLTMMEAKLTSAIATAQRLKDEISRINR